MDPKLLSELKRKSLKYRKNSSSSNESNLDKKDEYIKVMGKHIIIEDDEFDFQNTIQNDNTDFSSQSNVSTNTESNSDIIINLNLNKKLCLFGTSLFFGVAGLIALNSFITYKFFSN
jgi:hypothetical protein